MAVSEWLWLNVEGSASGGNFKFFNSQGQSMDQFYVEDGTVFLSQVGPTTDYYKGWWEDPTNGQKYYFRTTYGSRVEGWQFIDNAWRYFRQGTGTQAFGWQFIDGSWYYLRDITGTRVTGRQYIDERWYSFSDEGRLQGNR